jgi:hypothetical protein
MFLLLLAAFAANEPQPAGGALPPASTPAQPLIEPLSERELDVLRLIAQGLSNQAIGERLFLALDTVKGHNRHIFDNAAIAALAIDFAAHRPNGRYAAAACAPLVAEGEEVLERIRARLADRAPARRAQA